MATDTRKDEMTDAVELPELAGGEREAYNMLLKEARDAARREGARAETAEATIRTLTAQVETLDRALKTLDSVECATLADKLKVVLAASDISKAIRTLKRTQDATEGAGK
jgi:hypothetical protein